jgi:NAD+ synthase (glutamine-hydrolysing)
MRIALCPLNPTIGDLASNADLARRAIEHAKGQGAHLVALPELVVSGYPPRDLLMQEGFVEACHAAAEGIVRGTPPGITAVFGCPLRGVSGGVSNSLLVSRDGVQLARYDKRLLPTYDVFDEDRYFVPGDRACAIDVPAPGGTMLVGLAICEDLWQGKDAGFAPRYAGLPDPVAELIRAGAGLVVSPSASPFVSGKGRRHREIVARHAKRHRVIVASVNQLGGNDELVFDGHCFAYGPAGEEIAPGLLFRSGVSLFDTDPGVRPRALAQGAIPPHLDNANFPRTLDPAREDAPDELLLYEALVLGVRDYLRKTGFSRAILGLSGGIDSALTAVLAAAALGASNVLGVLMPSRYSSRHSVEDAVELAGRLGMHTVTIPIEDGVEGLRRTMDPALDALSMSRLGATMPDLADENLQSRVRGTTLMTLSNRSGAIVLTTGNKSEMSVGYATLYGDMNGGLAVLSDVSKQWVYRLARWINEHHIAAGFGSPPIPASSIDKAPSAELRPGQTDQDSLPPYEVLDGVVERYVEGRCSPERIARDSGLPRDLVERIVRMIHLAEYKRKQAAIGLKVTSVAYGSGRRWPIAQRWRGA